MLEKIYNKNKLQLFFGFIAGLIFGFLLQKGGVTDYNVIIGQLLLEDYTVVKIMLSAVITGMIGIHLLKSLKLVKLHPKPGSIITSVLGGLIFGCGFAILGYCPGTVAGAVGQGYLDALLGGVVGIILGTWFFANIYSKIKSNLLSWGSFKPLTLPELFKINPWVAVVPVAIILVMILLLIETAGW
ncbi:MAG: YeeE/YedE thiosulfate transporter family protein [bacterium]